MAAPSRATEHFVKTVTNLTEKQRRVHVTYAQAGNRRPARRGVMRLPYDGRAAREAAGFTPKEAARKAGVSSRYLLSTERIGAPYVLARRLAAIYGAPLDCLIFGAQRRSKEGSRPTRKQGSERGRSRPEPGPTRPPVPSRSK